MYITKRKAKDAIILEIKGIFDSNDLQQFQEAITDAKSSKPRHIVLDLQHLSSVDDSALNSILVTYGKLKESSILFTLVRPEGYIAEMLASKRNAELIPLVNSADEALNSS